MMIFSNLVISKMSLSSIKALFKQHQNAVDKKLEEFKKKLDSMAFIVRSYKASIEKLALTLKDVSEKMHERVVALEEKPCMKITEVFTKEEMNKLKSKIN